MARDKCCPNCGNKMNKNVNFCQVCGYSFQNGVYPTTNDFDDIYKPPLTIGLSAFICSLISFCVVWSISILLGDVLCIISFCTGILGVIDDKKSSRNPIYSVLAILLSIVFIMIPFFL